MFKTIATLILMLLMVGCASSQLRDSNDSASKRLIQFEEQKRKEKGPVYDYSKYNSFIFFWQKWKFN